MPHSVILLHGLGRTHRSMGKMVRALTAHGFQPLNLDYPSLKYPLETLAKQVWTRIQTHLGNAPPPLNFVTHSMGGIIVRLLARDFPVQIHRAVMLAPPNQGSEWVDIFPARILFPLLGAGTQLGTSPDSIPNRLGPVSFPLGILAGSQPDNPLAPCLFPGPNDGRVSVARTKVEGMTAHCTLPYAHFCLMNKADVIEQTIRFLETGQFSS